MSWALDGKIRIHARWSNTSYIRWHSWTSASLRRLYIGQFLSLHFKDRDEDVLSKGSKDTLHEKNIFSCTMDLPNDSASLVVIFVVFCFVFIWDESVTSSFNQKYQFEVFNRLQAFLFILFWGINEGIKRKHILHSLVADQSTGFLARSRVPPQRKNSREIG